MCTMVLSKLNEAMIKIGEKPTYELISNEVGTQSIEFKYRVSCRTVRNGKIKTAVGCGLSKKEAKQNAAQIFMQNYLSNLKSEMSDSVQSQFFHSENTSCTVNLRDCILHNVLKILCAKFQMATPTYTDVSASGPSHAPSFTIKCQVHVFNTKGDGSTKKKAKLRACEKMIAQLMDAKQYFEIFESSQLTESANIYCFSRDLKVPDSSKPIGVFGMNNL
ncbi:RISC-loading complex subunit tarbp2 isoform X2 [Neodiprion lecontei]|uniref:RISC-loading complex subunit tarbp2 isoform X2 n=1 Tax=Neodiprion lecontei TaxID=441921 RepID=A0ABM3GPY5_NEOLC|nr:RISC-loading complex subunit tarbp2 isoform X2 [Neodiprion lecontei]